MNTLEQLLALYIDPECHNAQRYSQTDNGANSRSYCVAVRSTKMVLANRSRSVFSRPHLFCMSPLSTDVQSLDRTQS